MLELLVLPIMSSVAVRATALMPARPPPPVAQAADVHKNTSSHDVLHDMTALENLKDLDRLPKIICLSRKNVPARSANNPRAKIKMHTAAQYLLLIALAQLTHLRFVTHGKTLKMILKTKSQS